MAGEREHNLLMKRLNLCLKRSENLVCADCPGRLPRWASMNLGKAVQIEPGLTALWHPMTWRATSARPNARHAIQRKHSPPFLTRTHPMT
jgi:hypothetical protein